MIVLLVFLVLCSIGFIVYTLSNDYHSINNLSIEILALEVDNEAPHTRLTITVRIVNPTHRTTPLFTLEAFIRPILFSSDQFIAESHLAALEVDSNSSTLQTLSVTLDPALVEVTKQGITMKTILHTKIFFNLIPLSKTGMSYYQSPEEQ